MWTKNVSWQSSRNYENLRTLSGIHLAGAHFELTLRPTPDFYTPLLSRGPLIKVLSPQWLADEIKKQHLEAAKLYEE
ncbi:MAG: hypothetical protein IJ151_01285 [Bacteroidales bacterium]|nr:hypothetical protein [Bacteroidales bacterium]